MPKLMRCEYCGLLQDEPKGVKTCSRCGGTLCYEARPPRSEAEYLAAQMELDQVAAPAGQNVERYLLVTIRTPKEVPPQEKPLAAQSRPPVNFIAVLDVSGSMWGEKIEQARQAVKHAVQYLRSGDVFSLVTFSSGVACPFEPTPVNDKARKAIEDCLQTISAGGMTALDGGLETGIQKALEHVLESNLVLLLSDGQTNIGELDLEVIGVRALKARQKGMLVSALGIGLDYNEALLAEIASQGGGRFYHLEHPNQIPAYVAGELKEVAALAARDVQIHLNVPQGATLVPLSATFPVRQEEEQASVAVGDIPCETELEIPLRLALVGQSSGSKLSVEGELTFRSPAGNELAVRLNRVTVRFLEAGKFSLREGVVTPVVERVLEQMRAVNVLGIARLMAREPAKVAERGVEYQRAVHRYASLLGDERAEVESQKIRQYFMDMQQGPASAKSAVANAFTHLRRGKKH